MALSSHCEECDIVPEREAQRSNLLLEGLDSVDWASPCDWEPSKISSPNTQVVFFFFEVDFFVMLYSTHAITNAQLEVYATQV